MNEYTVYFLNIEAIVHREYKLTFGCDIDLTENKSAVSCGVSNLQRLSGKSVISSSLMILY